MKMEENMIIKIISLLIILTGVVFIFDARILSNRWFGFGDQNEATSGLKILGFIIVVIGSLGLYFIL